MFQCTTLSELTFDTRARVTRDAGTSDDATPPRLPCFRCGVQFETSLPRLSVLVCAHRTQSMNGFPPCGYVCCKECFGPSSIVFISVLDDDVGLRMLPVHHSRGRWQCPVCIVRANLGPLADDNQPVRDRCLDLEAQRQIDEQFSKAVGTRNNYRSATNMIQGFGDSIGVDLFPMPPVPPPVKSLEVMMCWYTLNATTTGGRSGVGRAVSTVEGHNSAYSDFFDYFMLGQPCPTNSPLYRRFFGGLERRLQRDVQRAFAVTVSMVIAMLNSLFQGLPAHDLRSLPWGHPSFPAVYRGYSLGSALALSFLCFLRGNEAYQLDFEQLCGDTVWTSAASNGGVPPHVTGDYAVTKTSQPRRVRVPAVLYSKQGVRLGDFLLPCLILRRRFPVGVFNDSSKFFLRADGRLFTSHYFLHYFLRPAMVDLQQSAQFRTQLQAVVVGTMVTTNSLRRGGNTAAANAGVAADLRSAIGRWRTPGASLHMVDMYNDIGIVRLLSVSYRMCDASFDSSGEDSHPRVI